MAKTLSYFRSVAPFVALLAGVMFLVTAGDFVGLDSDVSEVYISLLPSIGFLVIGGFVIVSSRTWYFIPIGFFAIGCGLALMTGSLNTLEIIIPDMIAGDLTLGQLQGLIISMVTVAGATLGALFQRSY